ncbi:Rap1a/Tai family immunity protein [Stappia sp.]|jgi:hypothetical protein|uniref:Rap1a/Tai family immunity protein n=1 Tax=Stappia sp. TaxID=1870903 RepID=UPI003A9A4A9A
MTSPRRSFDHGLSGAGGKTARRSGLVVFAVALALAGGSAGASEGWQSGGQIETLCTAEPQGNPVAVTFCLGYLQGALDAFLLGRANCIPPGVDANGLRQALLDHLKKHPEGRRTSGPLLVYDAFRATWPACSNMPAMAR